MSMHAYIRFVISLFSFFVPLGPVGLIVVHQCRNATIWYEHC